jgi:hypothetical protein
VDVRRHGTEPGHEREVEDRGHGRGGLCSGANVATAGNRHMSPGGLAGRRESLWWAPPFCCAVVVEHHWRNKIGGRGRLTHYASGFGRGINR